MARKYVEVFAVYSENGDNATTLNLHSITAKYGTTLIPLFNDMEVFGSFSALYDYALRCAYQNNFRVRKWTSFGAPFYDIGFTKVGKWGMDYFSHFGFDESEFK